jgi:hypothetical protein
MSLDSSLISVTKQALLGAFIFQRAISCARFSPIESALVMHLYIVCWEYPRFVAGQRKPRAVPLRASELARIMGFDRERIIDAVKRLQFGGVIEPADDGDWMLTAHWDQWMDGCGRVRIHPSCHRYVQDGLPPDHRCVPAQEQPLFPHRNNPVPAQEQPDLAAPANRGAAPAPGKARAFYPSVEEILSALPPLDSRKVEIQNIYLAPIAQASKPPTEEGKNSAPRETEGQPDALVSYIYETSSPDSVTPEILGPGAVRGDAAHGPSGSRFAQTGAFPTSGLNSPIQDEIPSAASIQARMQDLPPAQNAPGCPRIDASPPVAESTVPLRLDVVAPPQRTPGTVPPESDSEYRARNDRFGGCFPGDETPDPALLARAARITERFLGGNYSILDGIERCKFQFPSAWILKAVKRTVVKRPGARNWAYPGEILAGWHQSGASIPGEEDKYDDDMKLIKFKPAEELPAAPVLSDEERIRLTKEAMKKGNPFMDVDALFSKETS